MTPDVRAPSFRLPWPFSFQSLRQRESPPSVRVDEDGPQSRRLSLRAPVRERAGCRVRPVRERPARPLVRLPAVQATREGRFDRTGSRWLAIDPDAGRLIAILERRAALFLRVVPTPLVGMLPIEDDAGPAAPAMLPRDLSLFVGDREIAELMQLEITAEDLAVRRHNIARLRTFRQS